MIRWMTGFVALCMLAAVATAQKPIVAVNVTPAKSVFKNAGWNKPIVITSDKEAAQHFSKVAIKTIKTTVDFEKQFVLIFAWRGSGGDRLSYSVAESYPEQISFSLKRGRTRDLRPHVKVYALRSNVRCTVAGKAISPAKSAAKAMKAMKIEATVTPDKPYTLPDGKTKITVSKKSTYFGRGKRGGTVRVTVDGSVLEIVPRTVIAANGYRYEFNSPPTFQFGHVRKSDMIFTVVESCSVSVLSSKLPAPRVALKKLTDTMEIDCRHGMQSRDVHTLRGEGKHFVSFKPTMAEVARFHPGPPELGARLKMNVITNFGAQAITLDYKKKTQVTIGPETITFESFDYNHKGRKLKVRISAEPTAAKAEATVLEYAGTGKPTGTEDDDVAEFIRVKAGGKYADAKLPIPALAKGETVAVKVKGKLMHGLMAIGGETTGTVITARKTTWELDVSAPGLRAKAAKLNGKTVVVTGLVRQKAGVEISKRTILVVKTMEKG